MRERRSGLSGGSRQRSIHGAQINFSAQGNINSVVAPASASDPPAARTSAGKDCIDSADTRLCVT
ncbi:Uncharacterised protein [Raoultella ornithinolytica]|nr:Uncharacterised protein [Raoultella ornithinolytica]